jgi:YgiT-type zinc finger domain-containing protein
MSFIELMNRQIYFTLSLLTIQTQASGKITLVLGNKSMKCVLCKHGTTYTGTVNVTLERDNCIIVLKDVPADIISVKVQQQQFSIVRRDRSIAMPKSKFSALLPNFWNTRSNLKDLEARSNH